MRTLADTIRSPILAFVGPARRGQDVAGQERRPGHGPQVRAHEPRRHPRRGGDPRPPAHLHRRAARPDHPEHQDRGHQQPGVHARRGRQDRHGLPGRPVSSALLEVLDPEQNNTFQDNYLEVPFDLSQGAVHRDRQPARPDPGRRCATGWRSSSCPATRSRRRSRSASGSSSPSRWRTTASRPSTSRSPTRRWSTLVQAYTKEAGVRNLEREIANVMRKVARTGRRGPQAQDRRRPARSSLEFLGPPRFEYGELETEDQTGAATGLVVTEVGGDVVAVEVTTMEGKEDFILTGQLGEVMRESARAGLSWIRAHAARAGHRARGVREEHPAHPRPGGRHPQGRSVGRHHDGHGHGQRAHRHPGPQGRGDDRRDHAARPGAADRRAQEQDPRRAPRRVRGW